jgi:esterase/lipase superfamily enzyme
MALEVAPFVRNRTSWPQMGATGCSFGGYHAVNFGLRHPDIVTYVVSMSGAFDIPQRFLGDIDNADAYLNSPPAYLPGLGGWYLDQARQNHYALVVGNQDPLFDQNVKLAHQLGTKQIPHALDVWEGFAHDWPWWQQMAQKYFL